MNQAAQADPLMTALSLVRIEGHVCSVSERNCIIVEAGVGNGFSERNVLERF